MPTGGVKAKQAASLGTCPQDTHFCLQSCRGTVWSARAALALHLHEDATPTRHIILKIPCVILFLLGQYMQKVFRPDSNHNREQNFMFEPDIPLDIEPFFRTMFFYSESTLCLEHPEFCYGKFCYGKFWPACFVQLLQPMLL